MVFIEMKNKTCIITWHISYKGRFPALCSQIALMNIFKRFCDAAGPLNGTARILFGRNWIIPFNPVPLRGLIRSQTITMRHKSSLRRYIFPSAIAIGYSLLHYTVVGVTDQCRLRRIVPLYILLTTHPAVRGIQHQAVRFYAPCSIFVRCVLILISTGCWVGSAVPR